MSDFVEHKMMTEHMRGASDDSLPDDETTQRVIDRAVAMGPPVDHAEQAAREIHEDGGFNPPAMFIRKAITKVMAARDRELLDVLVGMWGEDVTIRRLVSQFAVVLGLTEQFQQRLTEGESDGH